jgi:hypothetical protein
LKKAGFTSPQKRTAFPNMRSRKSSPMAVITAAHRVASRFRPA